MALSLPLFRKGIQDELLVDKFSRKPPWIVMKLFETANSYTKSAEAVNASREEKQLGGNWRPKNDNGSNSQKIELQVKTWQPGG